MDILGDSEMRYAASCIRVVIPCQMDFTHPSTIAKRDRYRVNRSEVMLPLAVFYSCLKEKGRKTNPNIF